MAKRTKAENAVRRLTSWAKHPNYRTHDVAQDVNVLLARLAEVEAEREELDGRFENLWERAEGYLSRAEDAEARLAAVLALCDKAPKFHYRNRPIGEGVLSVSNVRAAARGEGDR